MPRQAQDGNGTQDSLPDELENAFLQFFFKEFFLAGEGGDGQLCLHDSE